MKKYIYFSTIASLLIFICPIISNAGDISLNGIWEYGFGRRYTSSGEVPGLHVDPANPGHARCLHNKQ